MTRVPPREPEVRTDDPRVIVRAIERATEKVVKFVTLEVHSNLVATPGEGGTPVDTGFARASWIPAVGESNSAVAGSRESVELGAMEAGVAQVLSYRLAQGAVFVSNNVAYILRLNAGHSPQAEAGFVDRAVAKGVGETESAFGGTIQ